MTERTITDEQIANLPCSEQLHLISMANCAIINGQFAIGIVDDRYINIICDQRVDIFRRSTLNRERAKIRSARYGLLQLVFKIGDPIEVGGSDPVIIHRELSEGREMSLVVSHSQDISIQYVELNPLDLKNRLNQKLSLQGR